MALTIPIEQPVKFYDWADRAESALLPRQVVDLFDEPMYQFYDTDATWDYVDTTRILVLDSAFAALGELTPSLVTVGTNRVYTQQINFNDYGSENDVMYLAIVDANSNLFTQNYLVGGVLDNGNGWATEDVHVSFTSTTIRFDASSSGLTETVTNSSFFKPGAEYTLTITATQVSGPVTATVIQGVTSLGALSTGTNTFTFTAESGSMYVKFETSGASASTVIISGGTCEMTYTDCTPQYISSPFCLQDISDSTMVLHGCANNDYFGMFFETTGFIPRVRIRGEINDKSPLIEVDRMFFPTGTVRNTYVQRVTLQELRIDWMPSYLVNFVTTVFYLDQSYIDNVPYTVAEDINVLENDTARTLKAYMVSITKRTGGVTFKQIVNDPDANSCTIQTSGIVAHGFEAYLTTHSGLTIHAH